MKFLNLAAATALLASTALASHMAAAASDGTLGASSTGSAVVTLSIAEKVRVSNMNDLALGAYGGSGSLTANDDICVYHNGDGTYNVKLTDSSTLSPAGFSVQDSTNTNQIAMTVAWNDETGTSGNTIATYNTALASTGANRVSNDCSTGGLSANLQVTLAQAALQAAPAGSYSSTITVLVEPN